MPDDFLVLSIDGEKEIARQLAKLPPEASDAGIDEASDYLVNVLQTYPPKKYVSRKAAYGVTFFTPKQRRFFFAALADGRISVPYKRKNMRGGLQSGWKQVGKGQRSFIANETPYADLVMGDGQSRHPQAIGWKRVDLIIKDRMGKIVEKFEVGVKNAIRKLGL